MKGLDFLNDLITREFSITKSQLLSDSREFDVIIARKFFYYFAILYFYAIPKSKGHDSVYTHEEIALYYNLDRCTSYYHFKQIKGFLKNNVTSFKVKKSKFHFMDKYKLINSQFLKYLVEMEFNLINSNHVEKLNGDIVEITKNTSLKINELSLLINSLHYIKCQNICNSIMSNIEKLKNLKNELNASNSRQNRQLQEVYELEA